MNNIDFYDWMMPNVFHRERIIELKNGTVRVVCSFETKSRKRIVYIGEKNNHNDAIFDRILGMHKYD